MAHNTLEKASGVLTVTGNFTANDTVILSGTTYKFVASPGSANDIDIGGDAETSLENLALAINGEGTAGATTYFAGTASKPHLVATTTATTLTITARIGGDWGNGIDFREGTDGGTTFSISTAMSNGTGDIEDWFVDLLAYNQINSELLQALHHLMNAPVGTS